MELVILSTVATIAILLAELRDSARRERVDRSATAAGGLPGTFGADLAAGGNAANQEAVALRPELDRAA